MYKHVSPTVARKTGSFVPQYHIFPLFTPSSITLRNHDSIHYTSFQGRLFHFLLHVSGVINGRKITDVSKNGSGHPSRFALSNSVTNLFAFVSPGVYIKVCFVYSGAAFVYIPFFELLWTDGFEGLDSLGTRCRSVHVRDWQFGSL